MKELKNFANLIFKRSYKTKQIIDNPLCIHCVNFIPPKNNSFEPDNNYGKCRKFNKPNYVTGDEDYILAKNCREDNHKCGTVGLEFLSK
jgi:hypothetical protein